MKVKKYQAVTIAEAMKLVGKDIGPEALILSTKKLHAKSGDSGYKEFFEITAIPGLDNKKPDEKKFDNKKFGEKNLEKNETIPNESLQQPDMKFLRTLQSELMSIKELMFILSRSKSLLDSFRITPGAINIYGKLIRSGISEVYARRFMEKGGVFKENGKYTNKEIRRRVLKEMLKVIDVTDPFSKKGQVIAAFIGATGVGKTTTVAKLAANLYLKKRKSVGFISIDNYRIAALEQLKTYASILGIPCLPAFNNEELIFALRRLSDKDVILIDTAGQSHYDRERIREMEAMIKGNYPISSHLLLNTGTSEPEMERIAKNFGKLNFNSYIFTKTDETKHRGAIINQLIKKRKPVSYVTTGQRVPEDIIAATKLDILRLLF